PPAPRRLDRRRRPRWCPHLCRPLPPHRRHVLRRPDPPHLPHRRPPRRARLDRLAPPPPLRRLDARLHGRLGPAAAGRCWRASTGRRSPGVRLPSAAWARPNGSAPARRVARSAPSSSATAPPATRRRPPRSQSRWKLLSSSSEISPFPVIEARPAVLLRPRPALETTNGNTRGT